MLSAVSVMGDTCSVRTPCLACGAAFLPRACERRWLGLFQCTWLSRLSDNLAKPVGGVSEAGWLCGLQKLVRNVNTGNYNRNWHSDHSHRGPGSNSGQPEEILPLVFLLNPYAFLETAFLLVS